MPKKITLARQDQLLFVCGERPSDPAPPELKMLLHKELSYQHRKQLYGPEATDPVTGQTRRFDIQNRLMYGVDALGHIVCGRGFRNRIEQKLEAAGFTPAYVDLNSAIGRPPARPKRYEPDWANVNRLFNFRVRQEEALKCVSQNEMGLVWAVTGFGKMVMIAMHCALYPHAKFHIVSKRIPIVHKIAEFITRKLGHCGLVGGGYNDPSGRIIVYSADSMHRCDYDADFVLGDEVHELAAEKASISLTKYKDARFFGYSASLCARIDGAEIRTEAAFGKPVFTLLYPEAVSLGLVVPIKVVLHKTPHHRDPGEGCRHPVVKKRRSVWKNDIRNDYLASIINGIPTGQQKLVLVDTIHHAVEIKKRCPGLTLVYDKMDSDRLQKYKRDGVLPADELLMKASRKQDLLKQFESGAIDCVATSTWSVGVDPTNLQHVFLASPFSSETMSIQGPGRVTRINSAGKGFGYVHDFDDSFSSSLYASWLARKKIFKSPQLGWDIISESEFAEANRTE